MTGPVSSEPTTHRSRSLPLSRAPSAGAFRTGLSCAHGSRSRAPQCEVEAARLLRRQRRQLAALMLMPQHRRQRPRGRSCRRCFHRSAEVRRLRRPCPRRYQCCCETPQLVAGCHLPGMRRGFHRCRRCRRCRRPQHCTPASRRTHRCPHRNLRTRSRSRPRQQRVWQLTTALAAAAAASAAAGSCCRRPRNDRPPLAAQISRAAVPSAAVPSAAVLRPCRCATDRRGTVPQQKRWTTGPAAAPAAAPAPPPTASAPCRCRTPGRRSNSACRRL
jgi:hypothetical protein